MRLNSALISSFCFGSVVLAGTLLEREHNRRLEEPTSDGIIYNNQFSGALLQENNGTLYSITGTFSAPNPLGNVGSGAYVWVGIDGIACPDVAVLAGVKLNVTENGPSYTALLRWYPYTYEETFDLEVLAGDVITASIDATPATSGIITVENLTSGHSSSKKVDSSVPLCGKNAGWVIQDFAPDTDTTTSDIGLANFGEVTFTDAVASGAGTYTPDEAALAIIKTANGVFTSVSVDDTSVTVTYL